jgi:phospholipid transport system substrate-binding protein
MHLGTPRGISRRRFIAAMAGVLAAGTSATGVAAAVDPAEAYVNQLADEVMRLANSGGKGDALKGRFAAVLSRYVNLRSIANVSLGQYQKKISASDREKLYALFNNYAAALFVFYVDDFKGKGLEIKSSAKQGGFTTISSAIVQNGGGREQVKWRLVQSGGGYRVSDINVKGVWLTIATKKRFTDVLNRSKGNVTPLFAELKEADTW